MKQKLHKLRSKILFSLVVLLSMVSLNAQMVDTTGTFDPPLTDFHLVYAEVIFHDVDEDGIFDASFNLSPIEISVWDDYSTSIAFYAGGFEIRNTGSFVKSRNIIPVSGEVTKLWFALDVPNRTYKTYVQTESMSAPELVFDDDAGFRNTGVESGINRWSCLHNPDTEPDTIQVIDVRLETNSDPTLRTLGADVGDLSPVFAPEIQNYTLDVPYGTTEINLDAAPNGMGASLEMFDGLGNPITDGIVAFSGDGVDVEIIVTALDGTVLTYYVSIFVGEASSDASLKDIEVSAGVLEPIFDPEVMDYSIYVPKGTTSVDVTGIANYEGASVTGGGTITISGGTGSTSITVTSADESASNTYNIDVVEADGSNYALSLPGVDGNNSNVNISGFPLFEFPYTIEMWFMPDGDQPYNAGLFYQRDHNIGLQYTSSWQTPRNRIRFMTGVIDNYGTTSTTFENGVWHHLVAILTDSSRVVYMDGEMNSEKIGSPELNYADGRLYIGWDDNTSGKAFKGLIDEVRVWNDSLTAEQIDANRLEVLNGDEANLVGYWNFDLPAPSTAYDASSTGHHGVITGGTYVGSFPRVNLDLDTLYIEGAKFKPGFAKTRAEYYTTLSVGTTSVNIVADANDDATTISGDGTVNISEPRGTFTVTVTSADGTESKDYLINYVVDTDLTLKHSYTFANGTAADMAGEADGEINGGTISQGVFTSAAEGDYILLPPEEIAINEYPSITFESYLTNGDNSSYSMLTYFGGLTSTNSLFLQLTRPTDGSLFELNVGGEASSLFSTEPPAGANVHVVGVVTFDSLFLYFDGDLAASMPVGDNSVPAMISQENAWICQGGWPDPTYLASIYEFNIYSGAMDAETVALRSNNWPLEGDEQDASLASLTVDGTDIEGFASYKTEYTITLGNGTTDVPSIAATAANGSATVDVTQADGVPGTAIVLVTAADGTTTNSVIVNFVIAASEDATLSDLMVDGTSIDGFDAAETSYEYSVPSGTTTVPEVTVTTTDANATYVINDAASLPGTTSIVVTAEDGTTTETYDVNFVFDVSDDATLSDLTVNGSSVADFDPSVTAYNVELPEGTTLVPTVDATTTHPNASFVVNDAPSLPGATNVVVTAEDGVTKKTYFVNFTLLDNVVSPEHSRVEVYPTISDGSFRVRTEGGLHTLTLYNLTGTKVSKIETYDQEFEITTPQPGMYILRVDYNDAVETFRIVHAK